MGAQEEAGRRAISRRSLITGALGAAVLVGVGALGATQGNASPILRPPGGQDEETLRRRCIHCEKCREACPQDALQTLGIERGISATRTPTFNFHRGWCNSCEDANNGHPLCAQVCPTGALELPVGVEPKHVVIGVAEINRDWCLAWQNKNCKVCVERCPYEGVVFDSNKRPIVQPEKCNGCGLCENVCISLTSASVAPDATNRAIVVVPDPERREVTA